MRKGYIKFGNNIKKQQTSAINQCYNIYINEREKVNESKKHKRKGRCVLNQSIKESGPSYDSSGTYAKNTSVVNLKSF